MTSYEVWATRWDDPHRVALIPATDLSFSLPLSDHGECSFTARVEAGRSPWRQALSVPMSGVLVTRDTVPIWDGWLTADRFQGGRAFTFNAREWGHFFEEKAAQGARAWAQENDHKIFRDLVTEAQLVSGQDVHVTVGTSLGAAMSDRVINAWDDTTAGREFRSVGDAADGPEWYFGSAGTFDNPVRQLVLGDRLGHTTAQTVLVFVEDTIDYRAPGAPPTVLLLGDLFPAGSPLVPVRRVGGNLIAQGRTQDVATAATVARAFGAGEESSKLLKTATATTLLGWGWPRMTKTANYDDVTIEATLQAHANADLAATAGIPTGYSLVSLDGSPDWTQIPRGSSVRVVLDTDVYGEQRPLVFESRLQDLVVRVPDTGAAQVEWRVATVLEV
jgi:murein DD-endopeptidase MepM/ murein hydrolase activator NlpD